MAGNVTGLNVFQDAISPEPLVKLDQNFNALQTALNTLNTFSNFLVDTGTPNNLNVTAGSSQYASYSDGLQVLVRIGNTNTGPSTLNINNMGPKPVIFPNGSALSANALVAGSIQSFVYNASLNAFQLIGIAGGALTVTAPLGVIGPNGEPLFTVRTPVAGSGECLITMGPGSAGAIQSGPVLCLDGMTNYPVLNVWAANATVPDVYVAEFAAGDSCTPGFSNGIWISAGTNASDAALVVENCASANDPPNRQQFCIMRGDGSGSIGPQPNQLAWDTAGNFTLTGTATLPPAASINSIGDVTITNPQNGQSLIYDSATQQWVNGPAQNALATLNDVVLSGVTDGQSLIYNSATQRWINSTPVTALEGLSNVRVSGPAAGQVLTYSVNPLPGWVNATIPGYNFLTNLGVGANPLPGWVLTWDGNAWVGAAPGQVAQFPLSSLTDVGITTPLNRQVLTYDAPSGKWINAPAPSPSLSTLPDVALTSQSQGQVLAWDNSLHRWVNSSLPGGSVIALDTLMDTNISDAQNNQVLTWDYASARWVNRAPAFAPVLTTAIAGQVLTYNGTNWVNGPATTALAQLSDVTLTTPTDGQVLVYNATGQHWVNGSTVQGTFTIAAAASGTTTANIANFGMGVNVGLSSTADNFYNQGNRDFVLGTSAAGSLWFYTNGSGRVAINPAGAINVATPTTGDALTINAAPGGNYAATFNCNTSTPRGVQIVGGLVAADVPFIVRGPGGTPNFFLVQGDGKSVITPRPNATGLLVNGPSNSIAGTWLATFMGATSNGFNNGVLIRAAGQSPGEVPFEVDSVAGTTYFKLDVAGSGLMGGAGSGGFPLMWDALGNFSMGLTAVPPTTPSRLTIQGRDSVTALRVQGLGSDYVLRATNSNTSGVSFGAAIIAGLTVNDIVLTVTPLAGASFLDVFGDGSIFMRRTRNVSPTYQVGMLNTGEIVWAASAARFKTDIHSVQRSWAKEVIAKLRSITYRDIGEGDESKLTHYGLVAEEVAAVDPNLVGFDKEGQPTAVKYDRIVMLLLPLVQELLGLDEPEEVVYG